MKQGFKLAWGMIKTQPPSGGCVLKRCLKIAMGHPEKPAAFGRLCVETGYPTIKKDTANPAAFGRLCVETFGGGYFWI